MSGIQGAMKSIRPYKSSEQYLYAMKEDLAEWLKELYDLEVDVGSFLEVLETGIWLCRHASSITQLAGEFRQRYPSLVHKLRLPTCGTTWNEFAQPGTFQARDNVSNFIQWCRKEMDIQEVLMFETEDLVLRKNEKNFVLCLLEVARRASRFGMSAPTLIQMEEEIENEIREDLNLPPEELLLPKPQRKSCSFKNLDQIVQCLVSHCTCPVQFSMIKVSEGKYRVGDSSTLIFVRILRNHVMVRVGGGWDTLQHYLDKHDPCRCTSLSHKQATKLACSPRTPVQHEITARFTPRMDNSNKPQPTLIVSRSQSPPPPVEWRSYAPFSLGPGRTVHASLSPSDSRTSGGVNRRCSDLQSSQVPQEPRRTPSSRVRERPVTPSQRVPAVELRSGPQPTNSTQSRREGYSSQQNGSAENGPHTSKTLQDHQRGRTTVAVRTMVTPPKEQRGGAHQPPGSTQKDGKSFQPNCVSHQAQHLGFPKAVKAPVGSSPMPPERGVTERGWRKGDPLVKRTSSPVKHVQRGYGEDHSASTGVKVGPTSYRSQTPCQRDRVELRLSNGSLCVAKDSHQRPRGERVPQGEIGPFEEQNGPGEVLRGKRCCGEPTVQKERVYTPLPINPAEEQALYRSLEDEILSNIKELEADDNHKGCNGPLIPSMSGCNGSRPLIPSGQKPVCGDGVPRSGVYIPESVVRWPPAGLHYDSVIQELSRALHQECGGTEKHCPALVNGNQAEKKVVEREGSGEKCVGIQPEGAAPSQPSQGRLEEVHTKGGSPEETPNAASHSPEIVSVQGDTKPPPSKPRRSLKKPERVPSIYKLKLRPKIRPRRDNRPEKRPSKIPTPVFYGLAHRASSGKGQTKARNAKRQAHNCAAGSRQNKTGHIGGEEEATVSERSTSAARGRNSGEKMVVAGGKTELTDEDEAWV